LRSWDRSQHHGRPALQFPSSRSSTNSIGPRALPTPEASSPFSSRNSHDPLASLVFRTLLAQLRPQPKEDCDVRIYLALAFKEGKEDELEHSLAEVMNEAGSRVAGGYLYRADSDPASTGSPGVWESREAYTSNSATARAECALWAPTCPPRVRSGVARRGNRRVEVTPFVRARVLRQITAAWLVALRRSAAGRHCSSRHRHQVLAELSRQAMSGTGPSRTPNTFPSGSLNHAPRAGPIWAMKLVVFGVSYSSKVTPLSGQIADALSTSVDLGSCATVWPGVRWPAPHRKLRPLPAAKRIAYGASSIIASPPDH